MENKVKIAVSGATGFIGSALIQKILEETDLDVVALSRREGVSQHPKLEVKPCDLYNLGEVRRGLAGCDIGIYLVHSMLKPSSRLVQGRFNNFDFILADNFARAAAKNNLKLIIYVSGLVPHDGTELSKHLASRLEVEKTLKAWGVPVITLRSGLVIGPNGSSFPILQRLIQRLPILLLPSWMKNATQVVYIEDLLKTIMHFVRTKPSSSQSFDIVNPSVLTYKELLIRTAKAMGKKRWLVDVPWIPLWVSKFWVYIITQVPKQLVFPLIESLVHSMLARQGRQIQENSDMHYTNIDEALRLTVQSPKPKPLPVKWSPFEKRINEVQSVQRLPLPPGWTASDVAEYYNWWIPHFFRSVLNASKIGDVIVFYFVNVYAPLLKMKLREEPEYEKRRAFDIVGGWLVVPTKHGWLEFREGTDPNFVFASIYRFKPTLPWFVYLLTQAQMHAWVMKRFAKALKKAPKKRPSSQ